MNSLISFPKSASVNRVISKTKIYQETSPTQKIKDQFVKEVQKIVWEYKLSDTTLNIQANKSIKEFQIFSIHQKNELLPESIIRFIDRAIPSPIIFKLHFNNNVTYALSVKDDKHNNYYYSNHLPTNSPKEPIPVLLDIESLYHQLAKIIIDIATEKDITIYKTLEIAEQIKSKEKELQRLESMIIKEKQFNRKVELNREIKDIKIELEEIKIG